MQRAIVTPENREVQIYAREIRNYLAAAGVYGVGRIVQRLAEAITDGIQDRIVQASQDLVEAVQSRAPAVAETIRNEIGEFVTEFTRGSQPLAAAHQAIQSDSMPERIRESAGMQSQSNLLESDKMSQVAAPERNVAARTAASTSASSSGQKGNKETPVYYHKPTYGLRETQTVILPVTFYFSAAMMDKQTPLIFKFRTNHYRQTLNAQPFVAVNLNPLTLITDAQRTLQKSFYNIQMQTNASGFMPNSGGIAPYSYTGPLFPKTFTSGSSTIVPAYSDYWEEYYDYFTVLNCNYEVAIQNAMTNVNHDLVISYHQESQGPSGTSGVIPDIATYHDSLILPQLNWKHIGPRTQDGNGSDTVVLRGNIEPGDARRDVVNDEDIKTWTAIGSQPSLEENMRIHFWAAPTNQQYPLANTSGTSISPTKCNVQVTLKYTVQFKDLKPQARWPTAGHVASLIKTIPQDIKQSFSNISPV